MLEPTRHDERRRYEILRVVNRGGMGEIALGRVNGTGGFEKLVILKRLRADAEREDHIAMFDVEQEVMSRIEHPNIVKVFDQPIIDHIPYLAMEYVRGRNLDQIIRAAQQSARELSVEFALSVISEVLRGLAFVHRLKDNDGHALGVVHQDMTPSNVMVSFFGEVKVTDFGISYVTSRDGGLRKGVLKGKPRYVAPEVLAGKRVNNTADIYGVGVVLYELLTGQALFARASVKETLSAVAKNELPDFSLKLGEHGEGVVRILEKSTKKDPTERYRTAEAMAADVLNELTKRGGPVPPATLGYQVRVLFNDDPDVPEMDPALEEAIVKAPTLAKPGMQAADLDQTLLELDRLLGNDDSSVDLFQVPPEIHRDLSDMPDMEPFVAKTPLPDFVWDAKNDDEILAKAQELYGPPEPRPLFPELEAAPPPRMPPPMNPSRRSGSFTPAPGSTTPAPDAALDAILKARRDERDPDAYQHPKARTLVIPSPVP
ncbi:MAG: serine/threonine protein kinase, partial [Myxococcales bacterium]|nr:serine/threonine protein kinase [Myxococcales bacterium]